MLVLVMGMGRSGTSLLMQTLQAAGFDSGTDLIPADEHNPKGYIESMSIMSFNVSLLNAASGNPEDQFPLPDEDAIERLVGTPIPVQFPQHDYAVKDPRFTLTFPIWYPYLKQFDLRVVLARRNTESIAESVLRASGVPLARIISRRPALEPSLSKLTQRARDAATAVHQKFDLQPLSQTPTPHPEAGREGSS